MYITNRFFRLFVLTLFSVTFFSSVQAKSATVQGWLEWRGPHQNGVSDEKNLPTELQPGGDNQLWEFQIRGRGTPVIAGDRLYSFCYEGTGQDLQEFLLCLDANTGKEIWRHAFNDFISDVVYDRYSIGSPTVDADTGNIYLVTSAGEMTCFSPDGELQWSYSMMEQFGMLTFPNGRRGAPAIDGDIVIINLITANWGGEGPARNRFYGFDKNTGDLIWSSTPGIGPKDSSFATPVFAWLGNQRVFYCGTGCGNVVCINANTGEPIWRFLYSLGGVNSSIVMHGDDKIIAIHGVENVDNTETGRMIAINVNAKPEPSTEGAPLLPASAELWRNPLCMFTSSPVIVGDHIFQLTQTGELACVDANNGKILWQKKLATDQLHASPLYADGKLYVPMQEGTLFVLKPGDTDAEILSESKLEGNALGSPAVWNGKIYVHTTEKLYCFGDSNSKAPVADETGGQEVVTADRVPSSLQLIPSEVLMRPGETVGFKVNVLDQFGGVVKPVDDVSTLKWERFIPPTARVRSEVDADFNDKGQLTATADSTLSAGAFKATSTDGLSGTNRGRLLPVLPYHYDFEEAEINVEHALEQGVKFAYPPLPWIGARFKWEIREVEGNKVLAKTLDNVLFQRAMTFIGHPDMKNYTISAEVMTDGNRRTMSNAGVINQRYIISLVGNSQKLEVTSNYNRINVSVPFTIKPNIWYHVKSRVDVAEDGSGIVRGKAWEKGQPEPEAWTIEVPHKHAHTQGVPGIYGFSPQARYRVYVDNVTVTSNE